MRTRQSTCAATLAFLAMALVPGSVLAASHEKGCWKIETETKKKNSPKYTQPGLYYKPWAGAADAAGQGAYPMTVQITGFSNDGDLIGSSTASLDDMGREGVGSYRGEQVLFRCSPDAGDLQEFFSTNGDNPNAGKDDISHISGIPGTYRFPEENIISRVTNLDTNQVVTRYWLARQMKNLDKDEQGWTLVKVKNFSRYKVDLYQCKACGSETDSWMQPIAYVAFKGGAGLNSMSPNLSVGADHNNNWSGWHNDWPGAINPKPNLNVRTGKVTCAVRNTTPVVNFPPMSVAELEGGKKATMPITIDIQCESGFGKLSSGTGANQTAMGIMARDENAAYARPLGLVTGGSAVTDLLSDGYGGKNVAQGVSVVLYESNGTTPIYFLTSRYLTMGGAKDGWYPVLQDATQTGSDINWDYYTRTVNATFEAFHPGKGEVSAGKYKATAEVVIAIQ